MENGVYVAGTAWGLLPIAVIMVVVFATRKIILALFSGILVAAFLVANNSLIRAVVTAEQTIVGVFFGSVRREAVYCAEQSAYLVESSFGNNLFMVFSRWYVGILIFLLALGIVTAFVIVTGGAKAFVTAVSSKVRTRRGVQYLNVVLGILLMIDDYFNALINGNVGTILSSKHKLSRTRVSYTVDSIAAPICIIAPVSSWAVAIMGNITTAYESIGIYADNVFLDFIRLMPYHFYVFAAIGLVLITITFDWNMKAMKRYEDHLRETGVDLSTNESEEMSVDNTPDTGTLTDFFFPLLTLVIVTVGTMFVTGWQGSTPELRAEDGIFAILSNWSLSLSLYLGGLCGGAAAFWRGGRAVKKGFIDKAQYWGAVKFGLKSMGGAIIILVFAWTIADLVGQLEVGRFAGDQFYALGLPIYFIPLAMFILAAILAFSIGTSWGTFAIGLPIAAGVVAALDPTHSMLFPAMSAVLSGAVFGDHASPISDTTILSATGARCGTFDHFFTQLPYALIAAGMAALGYLGFGVAGGNLLVGFLFFAVGIVAVAFLAMVRTRGQREVKIQVEDE